MEIINFLGAAGIGALLTTIIGKILDYKLKNKEFQFQKLYIKRAEVIEETYKKLSKMRRAIESLMAPMQLAGVQSQEEKSKEASKLANDFIQYFDDNRIYFEENLEQKIDKISEEFRNAWIKFGFATQVGEKNIDEWINAWKKVKEEIPNTEEEIKIEFRKIIGI